LPRDARGHESCRFLDEVPSGTFDILVVDLAFTGGGPSGGEAAELLPIERRFIAELAFLPSFLLAELPVGERGMQFPSNALI